MELQFNILTSNNQPLPIIYVTIIITLIILLFDLLSVISPVRVCYQLVRCKLVISGRAQDRL